MKCRIAVSKQTPARDYSALKSDAETRNLFDTKLIANLHRAEINQSSPADSFSNLKSAITDAAESVLPAKKSQPLRKRQVSDRTRELYNNRKINFSTLSKEQRRTASHEITKSIRDDYLAYMDSILCDMKEAEAKGNSREITRLRKLICSKSGSSSNIMPSKDLEGEPIVSEKQLLNAWNKFLADKFASPVSDKNRHSEATVCPEDTLSEAELEDALKSLKDGKAPGADGIPIEAYKYSDIAKCELFRIAMLIWDTESIPSDIIIGIFIMLYKKNSRDDFGNYRAICLLCHAYKLISAVIARRLHSQLEHILPDSQAGFRPARGTRDNVCILKWSIKMILREGREAVVSFIDYKAAFDTESQKFLDEALSDANVSYKVRRIIQAIFEAASGCVRIGNSTSDTFNISRGVLQGDIFSPVAFIAGLWKIFTAHDRPQAGITVGCAPHTVTVSSLEYADDAGLLDVNVNEASERLSAISEGSRSDAAMIISIPKTKALHIHKTTQVTDTAEDEVAALKLKHQCPDCSRTFPTERGMKIHLSRWCDGGKTVRSRKGSLADKAVQLEKKKQAENERDHVFIEGEQIDNVHSFEYLGSDIQCDGEDMADVKHRMNIAQAAFTSMSHIWKDHRLPLSMKLGFYIIAVCSTFTHACEAWSLTEKVRKSINGFNSRCLHVITKRTYRETATNPPFNLVLAIRKRRMRYLGHILRMSPNRLLRRTFMAYTHGGNGAPDGGLMDDCNSLPIEELALVAHDRRRWNSLVNDLQ